MFFRYVLNGLFELTEISSLQPVSGVFGCLIFALSLYGGLALSLEDVQHRTVLPSCRHDEQVAPSQRRPASQSNFRGFGFLYRKERRADVLPASPEARMFSTGRGKRE